jgi:hypothetical protein
VKTLSKGQSEVKLVEIGHAPGGSSARREKRKKLRKQELPGGKMRIR